MKQALWWAVLEKTIMDICSPIYRRDSPKGWAKAAEGKVGWTKAAELVKVARSEGKHFDCATWLHRAQSFPKEEFKREVERHLTGKDAESTEIIYFKLSKSQVPVIERQVKRWGLSDKNFPRLYWKVNIGGPSLTILVS